MPRLATAPLLALAVLAWLACSDDASGPEPPDDDTLSPVILSDPLGPSAAPAAFAGSSSSAPEVTFVSLPPGSVPGATLVSIRNLTTVGSPVIVPMGGGGFDPVAVPAVEGDSLELVFRDQGGMIVARKAGVVPRRRPPVIVRTSPPEGRTDVALGIRPTIVFSEPVDPATVGAAVRLLRGGTEIEGQVLSPPGEAWVVQFAPEAPLEPLTAYQLDVAPTVRDLDGAALETAASYGFTTGTAASAVNTPPIADFTASCTGLTCEFTDLSFDRDQGSGDAIVTRTWYFYDDDSSSEAPGPVHTYAAPGYWVRVLLGVTDRQGAISWMEKQVDVRQADVPTPPPPQLAGTVRIAMAASGSQVPASFWAEVLPDCMLGCTESYTGRYPIAPSGATEFALPAGDYYIHLSAPGYTCTKQVQQLAVTAGGTSEIPATPYCEPPRLQVTLRATGQAPDGGFVLDYRFCHSDCVADVFARGFERLDDGAELSLRPWPGQPESNPSRVRLQVLPADAQANCEVASMVVQSAAGIESGPLRDIPAVHWGETYDVELEVNCG